MLQRVPFFGAQVPVVWAVYESRFLNQCNTLATLLHFTAFVCMLCIDKNVEYTLTHTVSYVHPDALTGVQFDLDNAQNGLLLRNFSGMEVVVAVERTNVILSLRGMLAAFFALSFVFQALFTSTFMRYVEYTFSGSLMSVVILLQAQQYDIYAALSVFVLHACCMLAGALADAAHYIELQANIQGSTAVRFPTLLRKHPSTSFYFTADNVSSGGESGWFSPNLKFAAHALGWVPFGAAWTVIFSSLLTNAVQNPDIPKWVPAIISSEFVLFGFFGLTQLSHLNGTFSDEITHAAYIIQSIFSKLLLAGVLSFELLM
eukprot:1241046-Rhodomonas_salina.1